MKKVMNKFSFALVCLMASVPAFAADEGLCNIVSKIGGILYWLRLGAFVGAAFYIAAWAWEFISKGEAKMEDVKKKGVALLVGFGLLFMVGAIITFFMNTQGFQECQEMFRDFGTVKAN